MDSTYSAEQIVKNENKRKQNREWKTIGVKVRLTELAVLNKQLSRLNYDTLGNLVKDLISGKITHVTEDKQIEIMKTNLQTNVLLLIRQAILILVDAVYLCYLVTICKHKKF
jgi:hypothetical protein